MTYLSFVDKIKLLFNLLFDFKGILIFSILILIFSILYLLKKINIKRYTIGISLSLLLVLLISIISNYKILSNTFDDFFTVFFRGIYFPSIYLYISTLVIVFVSFMFSLINIKLKKVYKLINKIMFVINTVLFTLIINIIARDKVDIFSVNSLYSNTKLVGILEISMNVFLLWIASLFVIYITNLLSDRITKKKEVINDEVEKEELKVSSTFNQEDAYIMVENPFSKNEIKKGKNNSLPSITYISKHIPEEIHLVEGFAPSYVYEEVNNVKDISPVEIESSEKEATPLEINMVTDKNNLTFNDILNGTIPVSYYDNKNEIEEYTLSNPQEIYEGHYNSILSKLENDSSREVKSLVEDDIISTEEIPLVQEIKETKDEKDIVTITNEIKDKRKEDNLINNTVSLNDLVDDDMKKLNDSYTIDDYKKIISMLNTLKQNGIDHNLTINDAVALSLINNYSIDDCLKFKDILESYLN